MSIALPNRTRGRLVEEALGQGLQAADAFEIYVDDVRYTVPTLYLITETDEAAARLAAYARYNESEHHAGVELWQGGRRILALGAAARSNPI